MPPPDESISNYESIILNSFEEDDTNIAVNGGRDEPNAGINYFVDDEGRCYYHKDIQNFVSLPIEQELQNNGEEDQMIVEGDGYQNVTLMPSDSVEHEISYVLVMQETEPLMNIDPNMNQVKENVNHVYIVQNGAESIDKGTDNFEESSQYAIVSEENTHTGSHFACTFCPYTNNKRYLLLRHLKTHSSDRPHKCKLCDRGFKTITALQNHVNMHNGVKPHACKQCDNSFTTSGELVRHMRYRHTLEKPHKCTECDYASVELSKLKRHVLCHTGVRPYQCSDCTFACTDLFKLKRHRRIHTGEKPYKCEFCKGSFTQANALELHKMIHDESEKPVFSCDLCPMKCDRKSDLRNHVQRLHTSEKPHQCNRCGENFPDKYTCMIHYKTHEGETYDKCEVCSYASTTPKNVQSHNFKNTNEKPYEYDISFKQKELLHHHENHNQNYEPNENSHICHHCSQMFANKEDLIRHIAIHDPDSGQQERELAFNLNTESKIKSFGDNINTADSVETVEIIELNLESDHLDDGKVMTVAEDSGQQYLVLEVIETENGSDRQINIIPPEEFLNKKVKELEKINQEEISDKIELNNMNKVVENDIDSCFGFDYEPDQSEAVEKEIETMTFF